MLGLSGVFIFAPAMTAGWVGGPSSSAHAFGADAHRRRRAVHPMIGA
jgi:hypothetical protein